MNASRAISAPKYMLFILILCAAFVRYRLRSACSLRSSHREPLCHGHAAAFPCRACAALGGVGMVVACSVGWCWMVVAAPYLGVVNGIQFSPQAAAGWCMTAAIATCGGTAEDVWHR
jgi:UDP-GlcNAc:undecaprenyl-phosphate GlcNAc-1-phosphate transferase